MSKKRKTIYEAIQAAATSIERRGWEAYRFQSSLLHDTKTCDTPMCAAGWILAWEGSRIRPKEGQTWTDEDIEAVLGVSDVDFYERMDAIDGNLWASEEHWSQNPVACAKVLRQYAQTYHPPEQQVG